ncbi:MAG: hypothetical protein ACREMF_06275 [Gemmatimonadales bacterium]
MPTCGPVAPRPRRTRRRDGQRALCLTAFVLALAATASAQLVPIRTVPLAQGEQFLIFPSHTLGMGSASIALVDSLLDPFRNPAMGGRVGASRLFSSPAVYSISRGSGGGRTLPLASLLRAGSWFGGVSVAIQEVETSRPFPSPPIIFFRGSPIAQDIPGQGPAQQSRGNTYAFASLGKVMARSGLSLGGSALWSRLQMMDGVTLLYPGSERVSQSGHGLDLRLGMLKEWPANRSLEALVLHHRLGMTQDVLYLDQFWDPGTQQFLQVPRVAHSLDRATTWGMHLAYQRPLTASGWRIGWIATVNRLSQPRIPEDEILALPGNQGRSAAYNFGLGLSKSRGSGTFAIDAVYEPIWSTTWAVAAAPVVTTRGDTIPAGARTIENRFRFSNAVLRLGVSRETAFTDLKKAFGFQLGLAVRAIRYRLVQHDRVAAAEQRLRERWVEWTPTWGLSLRFPELEVRYRGRVTNGAGRPGTESAFFAQPIDVLPPGGILVPPGGPLDLAGVTTVTHQISLSLPLR